MSSRRSLPSTMATGSGSPTASTAPRRPPKPGSWSSRARCTRRTRRDAILHSVSANARHGLPRTVADKRRAVKLLLGDPEWRRWSDTEIARRAGVGKSFVGKMRRRLQPEAVGTKRLARRGEQVYEMKPASQVARPKKADYITDWLYHLPRMTPAQLLAWQRIVRRRVNINILAEAVDVVMRGI